MGMERMAIVRLGNKTYGARISQEDFKTDEEWTKACASIISSVRKSASFFEAYGVDFHDVQEKDLDKALKLSREYKERDYPVKYLIHQS